MNGLYGWCVPLQVVHRSGAVGAIIGNVSLLFVLPLIGQLYLERLADNVIELHIWREESDLNIAVGRCRAVFSPSRKTHRSVNGNGNGYGGFAPDGRVAGRGPASGSGDACTYADGFPSCRLCGPRGDHS